MEMAVTVTILVAIHSARLYGKINDGHPFNHPRLDGCDKSKKSTGPRSTHHWRTSDHGVKRGLVVTAERRMTCCFHPWPRGSMNTLPK